MYVSENELSELLDYPALKQFPDEKAFEMFLAGIVDHLIETDFPRLCHILYRVDVDEKQLDQALSDMSQKTAGEIIAHLLLERQKQKLALRRKFSASSDGIDEKEKW